MYRSLKFLHMTDFSPRALPVVPVTNIRHDTRVMWGNASLALSLQMDAALAKTYWGLTYIEDTKRIRLHFKKDKKIWLKCIRPHIFKQMQWYKFDIWKGWCVSLGEIAFFTRGGRNCRQQYTRGLKHSFKISMEILFDFGLSIPHLCSVRNHYCW